MTEKRFKYSDVRGWTIDAFLNTLNGLDEKNKRLKEENEQLKSDYMSDYMKMDNEIQKLRKQLTTYRKIKRLIKSESDI